MLESGPSGTGSDESSTYMTGLEARVRRPALAPCYTPSHVLSGASEGRPLTILRPVCPGAATCSNFFLSKRVYAGEMEVSSKSLQRIARARASSTRSLMSHETPSASHQILMHLSACKSHQTPAPATFPATATTRPSSSTEGAQAVRPLVIARGLPSPIPVFWVCEQENLMDLVPRDRKKGAAGETDRSLLRNVFESRKQNLQHLNNCLLSNNVTNLHVINLGSNVSFYKYNMKSVLCYEVTIDILQCCIVWIR